MSAKTRFFRSIALLPLLALPFTGCGGSEDLAASNACTEADCPPGTECIAGRCQVPSDASPGDGSINVPEAGDATQSEPGPCASASFQVTETQESFVIPADVTFMHVKAWGAGGNGEGQCAYDDSGLGGYSEGVFEVEGGVPLIIIVGKRGRAGMTGEEQIRFGFGNWGGGGLSGVFLGPELISESSQDKALIVAGGGGGASAPGCNPGGHGNAADAGGEATMLGGVGADDVNGGGGGYEGGSGGPKGIGGKGGTGFVATATVDPRVRHVDSRMLSAAQGDEVPPNTSDADYDGIAGTGEQSGRVVIHFSCEKPNIVK